MVRRVARRRRAGAAALAEWIRPQLTQLVGAARRDRNGCTEIKFDGYRMHAHLDRDEVRLLSSRLEEAHFRALPETVHDALASHGSRCSAVALNGYASSTGSSRFQLASGQGRTTQLLRSSPITEPSTLLWAAPPRAPLRYSRPRGWSYLRLVPSLVGVTRHRFSRSVRKPGRASRRLHAGCRSGSIRASPELIPVEGSPPGSDIA